MSEIAASPQIQAAETPYYFEMQAEMGFTKHPGGLEATRELLELCHVSPDKVVLNVGCGAGISATYITKTYGCKVVGVDIFEKMVTRARSRAQRKGVADRTDFRVADAQQLPFEDGRFDILICESVNTFVSDRTRAAREYARVVKQGGYVGLNEAIWIKPPPQSVAEGMIRLSSQPIMESEVWEAMLEDAKLRDLVIRKYSIDLRSEARNQIGLLGIPDYLRLLIKVLSMSLRDPSTRDIMKRALSESKEHYEYMGYGLYVGRK